MTLATGTRLGRYEILSKLGAGGMGEVYRARDARLERDVAIKILPERFAQDADALARFQREGKAVAALSHPNIVAIYDIGTDQGRPYTVMELLEGHTLATRLKQGPLPWREAVNLGQAIAAGLAAAHARGIVHRDIKPENLFLTAGGHVKILDFGLARLDPRWAGQGAALTATLTPETHPGTIMGTIYYMSPEQVRGHPVDARSDVFAFGCVLYEMLTGRRLFARDTQADTMSAILHEPPAPLCAAAPPALEAIIARCVEKQLEARYASGQELLAALKAVGTDPAAVETDKRLVATLRPEMRTPMPSKPRTEASVAVLPFVNMSSDPENEYFSDGLAEELINVLSKIKGLRVAARTSAFAFKGKNEDVRKIGEQLGVRSVLEGSVRKAGNRLRITAQLVNAADGYQIWSETYNRQLEDVFAIQDEIAQNIAKALRGVLTEKDKQAIEQGPTPDVQAYDFYLRGRQFFHQFRRKGFEFACAMFNRAIAIDPSYARAYAGLADCHSLLFMYWDTNPTHLAKADEASRTALELDPELAEAHVARGLALTLQKQFTEAHREFETAVEKNPNLFEAYYFFGRACLAQGRLHEAAELFEKACQVHPEDYQALGHLGSIYAGLGQQERSQEAYRRAVRATDKHLELHPDDARALYLGAIAWCRLGNVARGLEWANRALAMDPEEPVTLYNVACLYSVQGETEKALDCLESALKHGFAHKGWIEHDADLKPLHDHPRFQALLTTL